MKDRLIFITNDDGVNSQGIEKMIEVALEFGRVVVVAPDTMQSGQAHSITMYSPLSYTTIKESKELTIYSCNGTPVDCVKMAFDLLIKNQKVDLVLSGINHGSNSAINVLYSGTMGAAIEGGFYGCPSIGFSHVEHDEIIDFEATQYYCRKIISEILNQKHKEYTCLNVNIPEGTIDSIKGMKVVRQCKGFWREEFVCNKDPRGKEHFWLTGAYNNEEPESTDTDIWALKNNYVSIVPIQIDLTNYAMMNSLQAKFEGAESHG